MVTMCVCHKISFSELKNIYESKQCKSIDDLRDNANFANNCQLCLPYIKKMIETGKTTFDILSD